jgi:O-antigen/teichoic acid export membrane protein
MFIGINVPNVQIILGKGLDKKFSKTVLIGAISDIILNFSLVPYFSYIGSCITVIIVELLVTILLYIEALDIKNCQIS